MSCTNLLLIDVCFRCFGLLGPARPIDRAYNLHEELRVIRHPLVKRGNLRIIPQRKQESPLQASDAIDPQRFPMLLQEGEQRLEIIPG